MPEFLFFYNRILKDYTIGTMIIAMKTISKVVLQVGMGALLNLHKRESFLFLNIYNIWVRVATFFFLGKYFRVRNPSQTSDNIKGTSNKGPITVASAAPEPIP